MYSAHLRCRVPTKSSHNILVKGKTRLKVHTKMFDPHKLMINYKFWQFLSLSFNHTAIVPIAQSVRALPLCSKGKCSNPGLNLPKLIKNYRNRSIAKSSILWSESTIQIKPENPRPTVMANVGHHSQLNAPNYQVKV